MKKIFAFIAAVTCSLAAMATNYGGQLEVVVNGDTTQMATNITVVQDADGTYTLSLKNFKLTSGDQTIPVGTIELTGCKGTEAYGITTINFSDNVTIKAGDEEGIPASSWIGTLLGAVPVNMTAKLNKQVLSVGININLALLQQIIAVNFVGSTPEGDVNGDGTVNTGDVTSLINLILAQ